MGGICRARTRVITLFHAVGLAARVSAVSTRRTLKPPAGITAFRFKAANAKPGAKAKKTTPPVAAPAKEANPKLAPLEKRLAQTRVKLLKGQLALLDQLMADPRMAGLREG